MSQPTYTFSVNTNKGVVAEMMEANARVKSELDQLGSDLQSSLSAWQTPSSKKQYEERKLRWDMAAVSMPHSLGLASQALERMTFTLQRTENAIADSWL